MIGAVGLVAAGFSAIRRKIDPLLICFALFAFTYGLRMWMRSQLLYLTMQGSSFYFKITYAIDFVIPIPVFLFFDAAGLLHRRGKTAGYVTGIVLGAFALATLALGPQNIFYRITGVFVIAALIVLVARSLRTTSVAQDFIVIRRGLVTFVAFAVWENIRGMLGLRLPNVEPIGFVALLVALGYVAAHQTLRRDSNSARFKRNLKSPGESSCRFCPPGFPIRPTSESPRVMCR